MSTLVQPADEDHGVGFARRSHGISNELSLGTLLRKVLTRLHAVVVARHIADIAAFVDHFGLAVRGGADALQRRIFVPDLERRGTAADGHHLDRILTHHGNGFGFRKVDRQYSAVVLQQHHALACNAARGGQMLGGIQRPERFAGVHRRAENQPQNPARLVVELFDGCFSLTEHFQIRSCQKIIVIYIANVQRPVDPVRPGTKFQIQSVPGSLFRVVDAAPIGDDHAGERPVAFENVVQQILVVAAMLALIFIVGTHDRPGAALLDGRLESWEVNLMQCPVVDHDVVIQSVLLLVVQREMLDAGGHAVLLHLPDIGNHHPRGEEGVLTHILEIAAVQRRAIDVHAGTQQDVLLTVARLLADGFAVEGRHLGIPRRGETRQRREGRAGVIRPPGLLPLVPQHLGADAVGTVGAPHLGNPEARNPRRREFRLRMQNGDLLFESHAREGVLHPFFKGLRFVKIDGDIVLRLPISTDCRQ